MILDAFMQLPKRYFRIRLSQVGPGHMVLTKPFS